MAEETKTSVAETTETTVTDNTPSTDELMAQIAQLTADRDKYKSANDKLSKENAEAKRKERDRMTEEEKKSEAQRLRDEELEATKAELNRMKAIGAYKSISSEKVVENLIEAVSNADHNAIAKIFDAEIEARVKAEKTEWLKSRPQANVGSYSAMTKEQIMAIPDRNERIRAIAQNQNLFS